MYFYTDLFFINSRSVFYCVGMYFAVIKSYSVGYLTHIPVI